MENTLWFRLHSKQLCSPSLKNTSFLCYGSCSYLNYHPEMLNFSLPHFRIKIKTATTLLGKHPWRGEQVVPTLSNSNSGIQYQHWPPHTDPSIWWTAKNTWEQWDLWYKGWRHSGDITESRIKDQPATTRGKVSTSSPPPRGPHHACPGEQFSHHYINLNGVILICKDVRSEYRSSKEVLLYVFLSCVNVNKPEILCL